MALLGRLVVIVFAIMMASLAAGIAIAMGVLGPEWHIFTGDPGERVMFWSAAFVGATATGAIGLLPLAIAVAAAESLKIRSLIANTIAGAVMLLLGYYASGLAPSNYEESIDHPPSPISREAQLAFAAGAVFGFVYWVIAGRNAGRWREQRGPSA